MHIGLTYDLRDEYLAAGYSEDETAEFDRADTIDAIAEALQSLGHDVDRIGHARQLVHRLAGGDRWGLVFNICEGLYGAGRESQVPAILDAFEIPYTFADPCVMSVCLDKAVTKSVVRNAGLPTPRFAVVKDNDAVTQLVGSQPRRDGAQAEPVRFREGEAPAEPLPRRTPVGTRGSAGASPSQNTNQQQSLRFPLFAKPIAEGTGKGVTPASRVENAEQLADMCAQLLERYCQPVLIEEYLPGREFTVGILGTGAQAACLGTLEIVLLDHAEPGVYSYVNKERCEELVEYRLVKASDDEQVRAAEEIALASWRALGCRDGGRIDLRSDADGQPQFLEANPLAGLHPSHSDLPMLATALDMSYDELIDRIVSSASLRCDSGLQTAMSGSLKTGHKPIFS